MEITILVVIGVLLIVVSGLFLFFINSMQKQNEALREQVNKQLSDMNRQFGEHTGQIGQRLDGASQMISNVHKGLGELGEASKQIYEIGKDISSLQEILQPPKLRGILGEVFLRDLLLQLVPTCCDFQHCFKGGELVDAVIKISERLVPVDAKFPLENFRKMLEPEVDEKTKTTYKRAFVADVKKHVDDIASKYILPDEGTYDFALMYIPAENVYYETITKNQGEDFSIADYAIQKRVIPVSPNTIYAYLQVIIFGLRGLQVEKHAEEILLHLARLKGDLEKFTGDFEVLGSHLSNATKKYYEAGKRLDRFTDKLAMTGQVSAIEASSEPEPVELPLSPKDSDENS